MPFERFLQVGGRSRSSGSNKGQNGPKLTLSGP